jgi:glycosyltransferase involved in cell wall biosynthesis
MPVYNGEATLAAALDSLLRQEFADFQLVISDNASTDATSDICATRARTDDRVRYVRQPRNVGPGPNFAAVLQRAETAYFMWAAHDDLWEPNYVATLVEWLEREPSAALACCDYDLHFHSTGERITHPPESMPVLEPGLGSVRTVERLLKSPQPNLVYGLFRTRILKTTSAMTAGAEFDFGDLALLTEVALKGGVRFVPEVLFHAGVAGTGRIPYSFARRRLPGFKLSYGRYTRHSLLAIARASQLGYRDRLRLSYALVRQVLTLAHWHEWHSRGS